jgi:prepilin-type N-terminal cleavage/methylation domain-containing protein
MVREPGSGRCAGFSLVELSVALVLTGLLFGALIPSMVRMSRALEARIHRSDWVDAVRVVANLLDDEVSMSVPGRDWVVEPDGGMRLRAFRGGARPCPGAPTMPFEGVRESLVRWQGERIPDPARDSLLVLTPNGQWHAVRLLAHDAISAPGGCPLALGERWVRWRWEGPLAQRPLPAFVPLYFRVYEVGRYSIEDRAFRYRRGTAGARNPLTLELFAPESRLRPIPGGVEADLVPRRTEGASPTSIQLPAIRLRVLTQETP